MDPIVRQSLIFDAPFHFSIKEESVPPPTASQLLVQVVFSAISSGTELLLYRDRFPKTLPLDETIFTLQEKFGYPMKYGYSTVGRVIACGPDLDQDWKGKPVFAFHPHESHFLAAPEEVTVLPSDLSLEEATLLPSMETAIHLLSEGRPMIGEKVVVFGQGAVGLMTTALLARMDLAKLVSLDLHPFRRETSISLGAHASLDPTMKNAINEVLLSLQSSHGPQGADLVFELSGNPDALNQAIAVTGYRGRIVIGSFYGENRSNLDLGSRFHRSGIRLISSQVSRIPPELSGSWTKARRMELTVRLTEKIRASRLITHRIPIERAQEAYGLLDKKPQDVIQILFTY